MSMQVCAAGYALTKITLKLQLVRWMVVTLIATKFKPFILPVPGLSFSNTMYIWIYMV
jgi:hypothetical protein